MAHGGRLSSAESKTSWAAQRLEGGKSLGVFNKMPATSLVRAS
jgi:hypothetical protein